MRTPQRQREITVAACLVAAVCLMALAIHPTGGLARLENVYADLWHRLAGVRYEPKHVVIVALDDQTLQANPDDPLVCWTPHFAQAMAVLRQAGAKVIGLDYLYYASIETWLKRKLGLPPGHPGLHYDRPFKEQLASGQVVMAANLVEDDQGRRQLLPPLPEYFAALPQGRADLGLANFVVDADGVVRHFVPAMAPQDGQALLTLAKQLQVRYLGQDLRQVLAQMQQAPELRAWSQGDPEKFGDYPRLGYAGPPDTFPRLSFQRLLDPRAAASPDVRRLKDKIIIMAYEPLEVQDLHLTPYAQGFWFWPGSKMTGPEVHANIVETLLTGRFSRPAPGWLAALYLVFAIALAGWLFFRLPPRWGLSAAALLVLAAASLSYLVFRHDLLLPTAAAQGGILLTYVGVLGIRLTGEERERTRIRKIFGRYVAPEVMEKLLATGKVPDLGGEACQVTVLFSDIRHFTTISEELNPKEVVEMLNTYFSLAIEPILEQGGTVDKFIGDAIMAIFGSPAPYADHARRAIKAALGLAAVARDFQGWMAKRFPGRPLPEFSVGVGLHSGEAIVGNIGSPKRLEFTSIGDTVNTASRLEGLSKPLGWTIVASRAAVDEAGPGVILGGRQVQQVKGRHEAVEVVEIIGLEG